MLSPTAFIFIIMTIITIIDIMNYMNHAAGFNRLTVILLERSIRIPQLFQ